MKKESPRVRKRLGWMRTSEARGSREYEDLAIEIVRHDWREQINKSIDTNHWMNKCSKNIRTYLKEHKLPQNPKHRPNRQNKSKEQNKEQNKNKRNSPGEEWCNAHQGA